MCVQYSGGDGWQGAAAVFQRSRVRHQLDASDVIASWRHQRACCWPSSHWNQVADASQLDKSLLIVSCCWQQTELEKKLPSIEDRRQTDRVAVSTESDKEWSDECLVSD